LAGGEALGLFWAQIKELKMERIISTASRCGMDRRNPPRMFYLRLCESLLQHKAISSDGKLAPKSRSGRRERRAVEPRDLNEGRALYRLGNASISGLDGGRQSMRYDV
jgi:hypothetical protein